MRAADLDVEHVDLAVDGAVLAVGTDVHARVAPRSAPSTRSAIEPATRSIAQLARGAARPARAPGRRAAPPPPRSARACRARATSRAAPPARRRGRGLARQPVRRLEVAVAIRRGTELHGCGAHGGPLLRPGLTRQSIPGAARIAVMRMYKEWTWVGAFGPDADALRCARARVGPARAAWWAVWDGERLHERTFRRTGPVTATPERVRGGGRARPGRRAGAPWAVRTGETWTRKRPARVHGTALGRAVDLRGLVDESAGRHARELSWRWSAGAGELGDGRSVTWNLVDGLHDGRRGLGARGLDRRHAGATSRRSRSTASTASATCASARRQACPQGEPARSSRRTMSSRSASSPARSRSPASCARARASWSATGSAG